MLAYRVVIRMATGIPERMDIGETSRHVPVVMVKKRWFAPPAMEKDISIRPNMRLVMGKEKRLIQ